MNCSERTRDSRGARPGLLRRVGLVLACLIGGLGVWTQPAAAQHVNYFWSVVEGSTTLLPGESVTLQLNAERDSGDFYWFGSFQVLMDGWGADDMIITNTNGTFGSENPSDTTTSYLGRRDGLNSFRNFPSIIAYTIDTVFSEQAILGSTLNSGGIEHGQLLVGGIGGNPSTDNPIDFFRIKFIASSDIHDIELTADILNSVIAFSTIPITATHTSQPISLHIIPSPPVFILPLVGITLGIRRKRPYSPKASLCIAVAASLNLTSTASAQPTVKIVNMVPVSFSAETHQDSEPWLTVDRLNNSLIVASAFGDPDGPTKSGPRSPLYVSQDNGLTWSLEFIVPLEADQNIIGNLFDITLASGKVSERVYAGVLATQSGLWRGNKVVNPIPLDDDLDIVYISNDDQPLTNIVINTITQNEILIEGRAKLSSGVFAIINTLENPEVQNPLQIPTETILDTRSQPTILIEELSLSPRVAISNDNIVYAAYVRIKAYGNCVPSPGNAEGPRPFQVVVHRDDFAGLGPDPDNEALAFDALNDGVFSGIVAVNNLKNAAFSTTVGDLPWNIIDERQERISMSLDIAVDPEDSSHVWLCIGFQTPDDLAICDESLLTHNLGLWESTDSGVTWAQTALPDIPDAINPSLAVISESGGGGRVGLVYQQFWDPDPNTTGDRRWRTMFVSSVNDFSTAPSGGDYITLADVPLEGVNGTPVSDLLSNPPTIGPHFLPYLGDYLKMVAVGDEFRGVFSANNYPDSTNFPNGVIYHRKVDWVGHQLQRFDCTVFPCILVGDVENSIDPFYFNIDFAP